MEWEKYLQPIYQIKGDYLKYIENSYNSIRITTKSNFKNGQRVTSLVAQWLRIRLPMQGTQVQALVQEDSPMLQSK